MWEDSVRSNLASKASADDYAAKNFPDATHPSVPHLLDFLVTAYLQTAKDGDAKQLVDSLPKLKKFPFVTSLPTDTALAAIPARFALDRGRWDEAAQLPVRDSQYAAAQSITYFARALGAARSGNAVAARAEIARLVWSAYLAGGALLVAAAAFNPISPSLILLSGLSSGFAAMAGLTFVPGMVERRTVGLGTGKGLVSESPGWVVAGLVVGAFFVVIVGPGIRF